MIANDAVPKSLIEQITDELTNRLKDKDGFDLHLIEEITELARRGELKKHSKLASLLNTDGEVNETA